MPLEELNGALMLLCGFTGLEGAKIPAPSSLRIFLARIEAKLSGRKFADHSSIVFPAAAGAVIT
jgi:hypothetical protein